MMLTTFSSVFYSVLARCHALSKAAKEAARGTCAFDVLSCDNNRSSSNNDYDDDDDGSS